MKGKMDAKKREFEEVEGLAHLEHDIEQLKKQLAWAYVSREEKARTISVSDTLFATIVIGVVVDAVSLSICIIIIIINFFSSLSSFFLSFFPSFFLSFSSSFTDRTTLARDSRHS
jgi:hypothetical protein